MSFTAKNSISGRCCAMVVPHDAGLRFPELHRHQCSRKTAVTRTVKDKGELGFCKHHDPEAEAARDAARSAKWKADDDAKRVTWKRRADESRACEGMTDPVAAVAAATAALEQICEKSGHRPLSSARVCGCEICDCLKAIQLLKGQP